MKKKNSIKRAQSQARLSFAERKNFRLQAKHKILLTLVALFAMTTGAWATEKSIDDIAVDDIIKLGDVISYTDYMVITYDGNTISVGNWTGAGTFTVTRGIPDWYTNVEDANGAYFLFNDSQKGLQGNYGLPDKTLGAIPYNESGLKVTGKTWDSGWECYILTVELAPAADQAIELTKVGANQWTLGSTPAYDVELEVAYFNITAPTANTTDGDIHAGTATPLINAGSTTEEGATIKYLVTATNEQPTSTDGFSADVPTAEAITGPGTYYVWYYLDFATGDDSDISAQAIQVTVADYLNYTVSLAEGTADADKWTIEPTEAKPGTEIKATYTGTKRVKSVKAVKKPEPKLDLATVTADTTVEDGYTVFGTLGANVKISIADGATVTLDGVTIPNGQIACSGNATIILMGTNAVTGANAAIKIGGSGTTLTITGSGSLTAQGGWGSAGIGTDSNGSGGNIVINGGTVTATGGMYGAGIGTGNAQGSSNTCGDITINGGRVTAQGGSNAAGIGTGISSMSMSSTSDSNNTCGAITIGTGVTMVTATKGSSAPNSIGKGKGGMGANQACGTITIGGDATTYAAGVTTSPFTYPAP